MTGRARQPVELLRCFFVLSALEVRIGRLHFRVDVAENLREPVVHLMCDANSLLGHREVGHLRVQMRVVDGNCGLHGETFERLLIVVGERASALLLVG